MNSNIKKIPKQASIIIREIKITVKKNLLKFKFEFIIK